MIRRTEFHLFIVGGYWRSAPSFMLFVHWLAHPRLVSSQVLKMDTLNGSTDDIYLSALQCCSMSHCCAALLEAPLL